MSALQRKRWLRFEIQHIFVSEIANSPTAIPALTLLTSVGFNLESRGNKMPLLSNELRSVGCIPGCTALAAYAHQWCL